MTVRIRTGGICGSDLHYYQHGGFGAVRLRQPMVLGHEIAGEVIAVGEEVTRVRPGDGVAVNPSHACRHCAFCLAGQPNHCTDMRFYGSAMRMPHVHGGFREVLVCSEAQAVPVPPGVELSIAAFAEPLAVCLHAARRAGPLMGQRVLVTGTGPIGALLILVARHGGAREVVATDITDAPLAIARRIGATDAINMAVQPEGLARFKVDKGVFDVAFEASGSGAALTGAIDVVRPGGMMVQVGNSGGTMTLPVNLLVAKELQLRGTFRFHEEFEWAVGFLASGAIDVAPLLTEVVPLAEELQLRGTFRFHEEFEWAVGFLASGAIDVAPLLTEVVPLAEAVRAFDLAADKNRAMKVQLAL